MPISTWTAAASNLSSPPASSSLFHFVRVWAQLAGRGDFSGEGAAIILNRDILINEAEAIEGCLQSENILSKQTILENHPWVQSAREEEKRLLEQKNLPNT